MERYCFEIVKKLKGEKESNRVIREAIYYSTEVGDYLKSKVAERYYRRLLLNRISRAFEEKMEGRGVFCMSVKYDDILMWSHYADNHMGICIEYECKESKLARKINYSKNRRVDVDTVHDWIVNGNGESEISVWESQYLTKGIQWKYEKEYRYISDKPGVTQSPFWTTGIIFGMNCPTAVETMIVKSFHDVEGVKLYKMRDRGMGFKILKHEINGESIAETLAVGVNPNTGLDFIELLKSERKQK